MQVTNGRPIIVITELPYQTNKAAFVADIARLVDEQKLVGAPAAGLFLRNRLKRSPVL